MLSVNDIYEDLFSKLGYKSIFTQNDERNTFYLT